MRGERRGGFKGRSQVLLQTAKEVEARSEGVRASPSGIYPKEMHYCFEKISTLPCSLQHYFQQSRHGNSLRDGGMNKKDVI